MNFQLDSVITDNMDILTGVRQGSSLCTLKKDYFQLMGKWQKEGLKSQRRNMIKIYFKNTFNSKNMQKNWKQIKGFRLIEY